MEIKIATMPIAAAVALAVAAVMSPAGTAGAQASPLDTTGRVSVTSTLGLEWGSDAPALPATIPASTKTWKARADLGSLYNVARSTGAQAAWSTSTGAGVTVAVIDTGISPVAGLDAPGKVINGLDLSSENSASSTRFLDAVGHGTHIAGIIAGRDGRGTSTKGSDDASKFTGIAPDARLLNVKVGGADGDSEGAVNTAQVVTAIDWVVAHRNDNGMNVRVLNMSSGAAAGQSFGADPLARAVENAWRAGIVVVAAAGNEGGTSKLVMPAADPYVIAVGSSDNEGTPEVADDTLSTFTNPGTSDRHADLLAPGKSVVSLLVPGSIVDREHPEGHVAGDSSGRFLRGTGTSQATAVVSGAAAVLLQDRPNLTPDQVKYLLTSSATAMPAEPSAARGAGQVNIQAALALATPAAAVAAQEFGTSSGPGMSSAASAYWASAYWASAYWASAYWASAYWASAYWASAYWASAYWASAYWASAYWASAYWASAYWA